MASIFTRILNSEIPGYFVWEDDLCFSIMTIQPIRQGHLLVIPREEVNHWDEVPPATAAHLMLVSQIIARAIKAVIPCKRVGMSVVGLEVAHTHLHLIPIDEMGDMSFAKAHEVPQQELADTAAMLREVLISQGHLQAEVPDR